MLFCKATMIRKPVLGIYCMMLCINLVYFYVCSGITSEVSQYTQDFEIESTLVLDP